MSLFMCGVIVAVIAPVAYGCGYRQGRADRQPVPCPPERPELVTVPIEWRSPAEGRPIRVQLADVKHSSE
jgi:hypothetical protein